MWLLTQVADFLLRIFAPWWSDPLFDRALMQRPYPRICLVILATSLSFVVGAFLAAAVVSQIDGELIVPASVVGGVIAGGITLGLLIRLFSASSWLED